MIYDRKIKYLEYVENGEKVRGAGFVKAELRETLCRLQISVKGLHETDNFEKQVLLTSDKQEGFLCKIRIDEGSGDTGELRLDSRNLGQSGISYEQLEEIHIPLASGKEIRCRWQERKAEALTTASDWQPRELSILPDESEAEELKVAESHTPKWKIPTLEAESTESSRKEALKEREPLKEKEAPREKEPEIKVITWRPQQEIQVLERDSKHSQKAMKPQDMFPLDDKWKQLSAIYPHITPFEDERDYLSLGPGDFVIFPSRYYRVVNNSFLLHGYHNYRHLILARMESRGEIRYYVGVPGNFYEKEKQVALMFGFESFECKQEPVRSGDYGYYMMRVEL